MTDKPKIMVFVARYLPGYKAGGPLRTIAGMVEHCADEFDFFIITGDRDAGDQHSYRQVNVNAWNQVGRARVFYLSPARRTLSFISSLLNRTPYDLLYLNSFFNHRFTGLPLLARWLKKIPATPVLLAPRGEFSAGAMVLHPRKKKPYLLLMKKLGLCRNLIWHASSEYERQDIIRTIGPSVQSGIVIAPDLSLATRTDAANEEPPEKIPGTPLRIIFISRITPKKNLDYALRLLRQLKIPVQFNIYGPIDEEPYWRKCQDSISRLPANIEAIYHGPIPAEQVLPTLARHDLFLLPTKGENYGHVIAEALAAGTPVLIADTTPWRDLEKTGAGWDLPLEQEQGFIEKINHLAALPARETVRMRELARQYAIQVLNDPETIAANRNLFTTALRENDRPL